MPFYDAVQAMYANIEQAFSDPNYPTAVIHSADGAPDCTISVVQAPEVIEEDLPPSMAANRPKTVLSLFFRQNNPNLSKPVKQGDRVTYGNVDYDVAIIDTDKIGGAIMRLRMRGQRWDQ